MMLKRYVVLLSLSLAAGAIAQAPKASAQNMLQRSGDCFIENKGQWDSSAKFLLERPGLNVWLTKDGAYLDQFKLEKKDGKSRRTGDVVKMSFAGAKPLAESGLKQIPGYYNYLLGKDKRYWHSFVHRYAEVTTSELYKGISLRYYTENGTPRYDLIVRPGADPSQIAMKFDGAQSVKLASNGDLQIKTSLGTIEEKGLVAYQEIEGKKQQVACQIRDKGNLACFKTGPYDKSKPLIIDPLIFSTYFYQPNANLGAYYETDSVAGGHGQMAVDADDNILLTGTIGIKSPLKITAGAYQSLWEQDLYEAYLSKVSSDGSTLLYSTYFGVPAGSSPNTIVAGSFVFSNKDKSITLIGEGGDNLPVTSNAYSKSDVRGGYMATFNQYGTDILNCSYFVLPQVVAKDSEGNFWMAATKPGPPTDSFVSLAEGTGYFGGIDSTLSNLLYGREMTGGAGLGGYKGWTCWQPTSIVVSKGIAYIAGAAVTRQDYLPMPTTKGALFTSGNGFLMEIDTVNDQILNVTDFPSDLGCGVYLAMNAAGDIVVACGTTSTNLYTSPNAYQRAASTIAHPAFIAILSPDLKTILAGTYLGGSKPSTAVTDWIASPPPIETYSNISGLQVDSSGNFIVSGVTDQGDYPITPGATFSGTAGGTFLTKVSPDLSKVLYSTYLTDMQAFGTYAPTSYTVTPNVSFGLDSKGNEDLFGLGLGAPTITSIIPLTVPYTNINMPVTAKALLPDSNGGLYEGSIMKIGLTPGPAIIAMANPNVYGGNSETCTVTLLAPAGNGGMRIPLELLTPGDGVTIPASITIAAGQTKSSFVVQTQPLAESSPAVIQAQIGNTYQFFSFNILSPRIISASLSQPSIEFGQGVKVTIGLNGPPPSTTSAFGFEPEAEYEQLSVSQGLALFNFVPGSLSAQATLVPTAAGNGTVKVFTEYQEASTGTWFSLPLAVTQVAAPLKLSLSNVTCYPGVIPVGTVTLNGPAVSGESIKLASSDAAAAFVFSSITPPTGATSFTFPIHTYAVSANTTITITASGSGINETASFIIEPSILHSVTAPASANSKTSVTCDVNLTGYAMSGALASLSSSNPSVVSVPSTCSLATHALVSPFTATVGSVTTKTTVTISATYAGVTKTTTLTVNP